MPNNLPIKSKRGSGSAPIPVDGRTVSARRFRVLLHDVASGLSGFDRLSAVDQMLAKQAATLFLRAETMQSSAGFHEHVDDETLMRLTTKGQEIIATSKTGVVYAA
jgi:hypothetical protein